MPSDYDVDARLAQGRPAVDDISEYVRACQQLGYHHPDLTVPAAQVYSGEDGLRLDALAADAAALTAMATAADDAVRRQSEVLATLPGAWSGRGAGVALDFLTRHQRSAVTVSAALREAADAITALRDELWRAVDAKVSATLAVDGRQQGKRAAWLAASRTVTTGAGDLASASELVDQQVKPFVDNDVRVDWLPAMRSGSAAVEAAYDAAIARVRGAPDAEFEVPGGLGPQWTAPVERDGQPVERGGGGGAVAGPAVGAALGAPAPVTPAAAVAPSPGPALAPSATPPPSLPGSPLGDLGGGTPSLGTGSLGTGLSGFGQQLADLIGGLSGSADDATSELDPPDLTDDEDDDPDVDPDEDDQEDQGDEDEEPDATGEPTDPAAAAPEVPVEPEPPPAPAPEPTPTPVPPPMPEPGPQDVAAEPPGQTPCEIAADELPQVGE